jgi:hypothetical protein
MSKGRGGYVNICAGIPAISGNIHNETLMQISRSLGSMRESRRTHVRHGGGSRTQVDGTRGGRGTHTGKGNGSKEHT